MNYKIESNIDFYAELNKELNDNNINSEKQHCLLSNNILEDNYITLDCSHSFNYLPLYNEICEQKNFNYLESTLLSLNEIKCPYCRSITPKLLPYIPYPDVIYKKGVNSPSKHCMFLSSCNWVNKSGKNKNAKCCKNAYKLSRGTYCNYHHNIIKNSEKTSEKTSEKILNIEWSDNHEKLNKLYKVVDLKKILKENSLSVTGTKKELINKIIVNKIIVNQIIVAEN